MKAIDIDGLHAFFSAMSRANRHPLLAVIDVKNILEGNEVAKNVYISMYGDGMIKSGGFEQYLYEVRFGKIKSAMVKKAFKSIAFEEGLSVLQRAKSNAKLRALDMEYYALNPRLEDLLVSYVNRHLHEDRFRDYCKSIGFIA